MANLFLALPAPAANAAGAGVDVSAMGKSKTIIVSGTWVLAPEITIEVNLDPAQAGGWVALNTFNSGSGVAIYDVAAKWMRARVSNFQGGQAPTVSVGSTDNGTMLVSLPAPANNGSGAAINVSAMGISKTVHIGGTFGGNTIIEVSTDGGVTWGQVASVQNSNIVNLDVAAQFMRVTRVGVPENAPGLPVVNVGGTTGTPGPAGPAGPTGNQRFFEYTTTGVETTHFAVVMPVARLNTLYGVVVTGQTEPDTFAYSYDTKTPTQFMVRTSGQIPAGKKLTFYVADLQ